MVRATSFDRGLKTRALNLMTYLDRMIPERRTELSQLGGQELEARKKVALDTMARNAVQKFDPLFDLLPCVDTSGYKSLCTNDEVAEVVRVFNDTEREPRERLLSAVKDGMRELLRVALFDDAFFNLRAQIAHACWCIGKLGAAQHH